MILCRKCRRLWPAGTNWCGTCRARLGGRECEDEHVSPVHSTCCTTCGSTRLSPGVPALNLRPLSWLLLAFILFLILPAILHLAGAAFKTVLAYVIEGVVTLAFMSILICLFSPNSGAPFVNKTWHGLLNISLSLIRGLVHIAVFLVRGGKAQDPKERKEHKH